MRLLRTLYGLVQAPLAAFFFFRYVVNVKKGSETAKELRTLTTLADLKVIPEEDRVFPDCLHDVAVVIILWYVDNTGV